MKKGTLAVARIIIAFIGSVMVTSIAENGWNPWAVVIVVLSILFIYLSIFEEGRMRLGS